jgi:hypothetical protein
MDNVKTSFGGTIGLNGAVSTKGNTNIHNGFRFPSQYCGVIYAIRFKKLAPLAGIINGKLNSTIKLNGNLNESMSPDLKTLTGDLL